MTCSIVVGGFFGDEGKGKIVSYLAVKDKIAVAARGGVGPNAGHSVVWKGKTFKMRMLPSTFLYESSRLLLGPGVLVDPDVFLREVEETKTSSRVGLDPQCSIIEPQHIERDRGSNYLKSRIGTTGTGCGPCNEDRIKRIGKVARDMPQLEKFITDVPIEVNKAIGEGKQVLLEGTQGTFLSLFHGSYPYVTSKDVTASSIAADVGVGPKLIDEILVVFKAYVSRVGGGDLKGELSNEEADKRGWSEVATVTGRRRRAAPFDFKLARRAAMLNSATQLAVTKVDVVFPECKGASNKSQLSDEANNFIKSIEVETGVPITLIGTGPSVEEIVDLR